MAARPSQSRATSGTNDERGRSAGAWWSSDEQREQRRKKACGSSWRPPQREEPASGVGHEDVEQDSLAFGGQHLPQGVERLLVAGGVLAFCGGGAEDLTCEAIPHVGAGRERGGELVRVCVVAVEVESELDRCAAVHGDALLGVLGQLLGAELAHAVEEFERKAERIDRLVAVGAASIERV